MGDLRDFNLNKFIDEFDCQYFLETGTGGGLSLEHACKFSFNNYYSIEIVKKLYDFCKNKFKTNKKVILYNSTSAKALDELLSLVDVDKVFLFWLDAHFPSKKI